MCGASPPPSWHLPGQRRERGLLLRGQAHHLAAAVDFLEAVDEVFRTLPAVGDFQSHELRDVADEARAVRGLGVPDRRTRLQFLDVGEHAFGIGFAQIDAIAGGQVFRIEIAVARASLGRYPGQVPEHVSPGVARWREARDLNGALAGLAVPDKGVAPARGRAGAEVDVIGTLFRARDGASRRL